MKMNKKELIKENELLREECQILASRIFLQRKEIEKLEAQMKRITEILALI